MSTFLDDLLDGARRRVADARAGRSLEELRRLVDDQAPAPRGFHAALAEPGVGVIAEVKRASPSKGDLAAGMDAVDQARLYVAGDVACISVLTEPEKFKGSLEDLAGVSALGTPTIRKDFIVDEYQLLEARLAGASAALLIVAALPDDQLLQLHQAATALQLDVLVEVHNAEELERAKAVEPRLLGVNARDLRTFEIDRDAFARLRPRFPEGALAVAESGVRGPEDVATVAAQGADAVLVGEALVTAPDPTAMAASLVAAGRQAAQ